MNRVYAALRPANLRVVAGPPTIIRGTQARFTFELLNTSGAALDLSMPGPPWRVPLGAVQTWVEPLTAGVSLEGCAPQLARRGAWVAAGGRQVTAVSHAVGQPFGPRDGMTLMSTIPSPLADCMPAGRYRVTVEYVRLDGTGDSIGATTLDLQVADAAKWTATIRTGGTTADAALSRSQDGQRLTGSVVAKGLPAGEWAWVAIRAGACNPTGAAILPPATLLSKGTGTDRLSLSGLLTPAAKRALSKDVRLSMWVTVSETTACGALIPVPQTAANRAPTTWGGGALRATDPASGLRVAASSEVLGGSLVQAVDGSTGNAWNSGGSAPGWIEIDLGRSTVVTGVRLMPSQLPSPATTVHRIFGRVNGSTVETLIAEVNGVTTDGAWTDVTFQRPTTLRYLRVATVKSPSWVAWREIAVLGPTMPKPSQMPIGTHDITGGRAAPGQCLTAGWSVDPDDPARHVTVRIIIDGKEAWQGPADAPRADVLSAGFGHGSNGFAINVYRMLGPGDWHDVRVQAKDDETGRWVDLNSTPKALVCS